MKETGTEAGEKVGMIARVCHEVNRAYCISLGDESQPHWAYAPEWQQESAIEGVEAHLNKPRTPEESHELWLEKKWGDGWVYGEKKDAEAKTHPCCVPYDKLPQEQRAKDYIFGAIVAALK